MIAQSIVEV